MYPVDQTHLLDRPAWLKHFPSQSEGPGGLLKSLAKFHWDPQDSTKPKPKHLQVEAKIDTSF